MPALPVAVLISLTPASALAAEAFPSGTAAEAELRVFLRRGQDLAFYLEGTGSLQRGERRLLRGMAGAYYRLHSNLRVGAFFQRQYGMVHDGDWNSGAQAWNDTRGRGESSVIADVTPRLLLDFLPGSWVGEIKTRLHHNLFNSQSTATVRPGLTYFWLQDDEPFLNFFAQYELYFPLNYGQATIYRQWAYLGGMYFWNETVQTGLYGSLAREKWARPSGLADATSYALGAFLVLQFGL
jgi:hypothetical protein